MNKLDFPRRRVRVITRPSRRMRRRRYVAAAAALASLGALAYAAVRHISEGQGLPVVKAIGRLNSAYGPALIEGVDEPLRTSMQALIDAAPGSAGDKAAALRAGFACIADISIRRPWGEGRSLIHPTLRRAAAPALRRGKAAGYIDPTGAVFDAPADTFDVAGPAIDVEGASRADVAALIGEWNILSAPGALPAALIRMEFVSPDAGWRAVLGDGTVVQWGRLDWTAQKISRLTQALSDARAKSPVGYAVDLRWFADGKVLLRPAAVHGGVR